MFAQQNEGKKVIDEFRSRIKTGQENPEKYLKQIAIAGKMTKPKIDESSLMVEKK